MTEAIAAPELREVAQVWWDVDDDPLVVWDGAGAVFLLVDADRQHELVLARLEEPVADPMAFAQVLADGLASCDFPPTGDGAAAGRVRATLRAAGRTEVLR